MKLTESELRRRILEAFLTERTDLDTIYLGFLVRRGLKFGPSSSYVGEILSKFDNFERVAKKLVIRGHRKSMWRLKYAKFKVIGNVMDNPGCDIEVGADGKINKVIGGDDIYQYKWLYRDVGEFREWVRKSGMRMELI